METIVPFQNALTCPACFLKPEYHYNAKTALHWLSCEEHGHFACGSSPEKALEHWNLYVELTIARSTGQK